MVNGPIVTVDLLQRCVAAGVPNGGGPVFAAGHQQGPSWIQTDSVHLYVGNQQEIQVKMCPPSQKGFLHN